MAKQFSAMHVGKWAVAQTKSTGDVILRFSFSDRDDVNYLIPAGEAVKIAEAILAQEREKPPSLKH